MLNSSFKDDDDEESIHKKMNESVNFLNGLDKRKHERAMS